MIDLIDLTVDDLNSIKKSASSKVLSDIGKIRQALTNKDPDSILLNLQKSGDLSQYFDYWQLRSEQDPEEIKATFQGNDRPIIEILIDLHILKSISGEKTKVKWEDPSIEKLKAAGFQPFPAGRKTGKKPDWNTQEKIGLICGVSKQSIQKLCRPGKRLHDAVCKSGSDKGKVNFNHPAVQQYKQERDEKQKAKNGIIPTKEPTKKNKTKGTQEGPHYINTEVTLEEIENLTIKEVVERYGGMVGFKNFVDSLKTMSDWKSKELKYQQARRELVAKNPVADSLFSILDMCLRWIVGDYPAAITDRLMAIAQSKRDTTRIEMIELQEGELSKRIKETKAEVKRNLQEIKN